MVAASGGAEKKNPGGRSSGVTQYAKNSAGLPCPELPRRVLIRRVTLSKVCHAGRKRDNVCRYVFAV